MLRDAVGQKSFGLKFNQFEECDKTKKWVNKERQANDVAKISHGHHTKQWQLNGKRAILQWIVSSAAVLCHYGAS